LNIVLQVKSGTVFDNFLITDDPEEAKSEAAEILSTTVKGEKKMKDAHDEEERKKREEEEKAKTPDEDEDEDEDDEDDDSTGEVDEVRWVEESYFCGVTLG